jgi:hypothetical protein
MNLIIDVALCSALILTSHQGKHIYGRVRISTSVAGSMSLATSIYRQGASATSHMEAREVRVPVQLIHEVAPVARTSCQRQS